MQVIPPPAFRATRRWRDCARPVAFQQGEKPQGAGSLDPTRLAEVLKKW